MPLTAVAAIAIGTVLNRPKSYSMRLNLHKGEVIKNSLLIERDKPQQSGTFYSSYTISDITNGVMTMDCRATGLIIDGKDRGKDLKAVWGGQVAKLPWTQYSR